MKGSQTFFFSRERQKAQAAIPLHNDGQSPSEAPRLTWATGLSIVVGTAVCFGLAGVVIGAAIAGFIPGYYRAVFGAVDDPAFEPYAVGLGLGLTQGIA